MSHWYVLTRKLVITVKMIRIIDKRILELQARKKTLSRRHSNYATIADPLDAEIKKAEAKMVKVEEDLLGILLQRKATRESNVK